MVMKNTSIMYAYIHGQLYTCVHINTDRHIHYYDCYDD